MNIPPQHDFKKYYPEGQDPHAETRRLELQGWTFIGSGNDTKGYFLQFRRTRH